MVDPTDTDTFSETTHTGFGGKLGGSLIGFIFGPLLLIGSSWGLFWNEGRAVTTARSLTEGASAVIEADSGRIAAENEGKLVHVSGPFATTAPLVDPEFQVQAKAGVLQRQVEMFQWRPVGQPVG